MLRDLDERLHGYRRVGDREHWPGEEPNAIYYDPERVRVLEAGVFSFTGDHLPVLVDVEWPATDRPLPLPATTWDAMTPVPTRLPPPPWDVGREARRVAWELSQP